MATTKSSTKSSAVKSPAPKKAASPGKGKASVKKALPAKPELTAKPKPAPKAATRKAATKPATPKKPTGVPAEQRRHYIEMAAYYIAERRGFTPGNPLEDWVQAEAEIDRLLAEGRLGA